MPLLPLCLVSRYKRLPRSRLCIQKLETIREVRALVIAGILQKQHIVVHLIRDLRGQERLENINRNLGESRLMACNL